MNSLYSQLNPTRMSLPNNIAQIKQMMNMMRNASNPQEMLQNMVSSNPQMKQVMDIVQKSGGDPKTAFYNLAKERGVNPDEIIQMLNS